MVEDVEGFCTEFDSHALTDCEVLEQGHIEVCAMRIGKDIPAGISKRQASRCYECIWVIERRAKPLKRIAWNAFSGVAYDVSAGRGAETVGHACVVRRVGNAEGRSGRESCNPRVLPAAKNLVRQPRRLEDRQVPYVSKAEDVSLIEVGTDAIGAWVEGVNEAAIKAIGSIVDGVAVSVGPIDGQSTNA